MAVIALDSSFKTCSVAVRTPAGRDVSFCETPEGGSGADVLVRLIRSALDEAGIDGRGLETIVVTDGPGTFTGQRAAISAAQGLKLASNATAFQIGSLEATALTALAHRLLGDLGAAPFAIVVDARRSGAYVQSFDEAAQPRSECWLLGVEDVPDWLGGHGGTVLTPDTKWLTGIAGPDAAQLYVRALREPAISAKALLDAPARRSLAPVDKLRPHYFRKPDAAPARKVARAGQ